MTDLQNLFALAEISEGKMQISENEKYRYRIYIEGKPTHDFYPLSGKVNRLGTKEYFIPLNGVIDFFKELLS
jgi:hypothetical protein